MKELLVFLAGSVALVAQVVEGTVISSATGVPVPGVAVSIAGGGKKPYSATTDIQGSFRIEGVPDGQYTANFAKKEFLPLPRAPQIRVTSGSDTVRLRVELTPLSTVAGRVLDATDQPVPGAEVLLSGSRSGLAKSSDKQGVFAFQVPPGSYYLSATPPSELKPPAANDQERLGWVHTYYPGVTEARSAVRIFVRPGAEMWGQDVRLRAAPLRRLRGIVMDPRGDPAPHVPVQAAPLDDETTSRHLRIVSGDDGSFEFPALHDGEWTVTAEVATAGGGPKLRAFSAPQIAGRDVERVELRLTAPFTLTGKVALIGGGKKPEKIGVFLKPQVVGPDNLSHGFTDADGNLKIENVYPGLYKIAAYTPGPPYYLASLMLGDREVLGEFVELSSGSIPIKVTFESVVAGVRGKVEDCGNAVVVLTPWDRLLQEPQFVVTAQCGENGRFELSNIRPGDYYAFAFDRWEGPMDWLASMDQTLLNRGVSVRIQKGEVVTVELKVTVRSP